VQIKRDMMAFERKAIAAANPPRSNK